MAATSFIRSTGQRAQPNMVVIRISCPPNESSANAIGAVRDVARCGLSGGREGGLALSQVAYALQHLASLELINRAQVEG